jgi:Uma2 family endonuclease
MQQTLQRATLDDLYKEPGKAELIDGRIVRYMATGMVPHRIAFRISKSLDNYVEETGQGLAFADNLGFALPRALRTGRESFTPDAGLHLGPLPANGMRFINATPTFAVEVRSESDYLPGADEAMAEKRADYFEAGTRMVWDVDPVNGVINVYTAPTQLPARVWRRGQIADIEPIAPGWRMDVNKILG